MRGKFLPTGTKYIRRYSGSNVYYLWFKHKGQRYQFSLRTTDERTALSKAEAEIAKIRAQVKAASPTDAKAALSKLLEDLLRELGSQAERRS